MGSPDKKRRWREARSAHRIARIVRSRQHRRQLHGRAGLLAVLAVAACLALAPNAGAAIYWGNANAIGGSELDGSLANQAFAPAQGAGGVAVNGQYV